MILKTKDPIQPQIDILQSLYDNSNSESQKSLILKDLQSLKKGFESEKQNAYYIDFYLKKRASSFVLHDIRIEHNGLSAQIDHIIISRLGIELLESKSFAGVLTINEDTSLSVNYNGAIKSFPSPIEQNKRHIKVLRDFLDDNIELNKLINLLGGIEISSTVLIDPKTVVKNKALPDGFYRADIFMSKRDEEVEKTPFFEALKSLAKITTIDTTKKIAQIIKDAHKPIEFDYTKKYKISKQVVQEEQKVDEKELTVGSECPFCQKSLVLRKGKNDISFLGCSGFPKCKFMRRMKSKD